MITKEDLELIGNASPILNDYIKVVINEGVNNMKGIIDAGSDDYAAFFKRVTKSEAKEMVEFLDLTALPYYNEKEGYEYSAKCKEMSELIKKYKKL